MDLPVLIDPALVIKKRKRRRQRTVWAKRWLNRRTSYVYGDLLRGLQKCVKIG